MFTCSVDACDDASCLVELVLLPFWVASPCEPLPCFEPPEASCFWFTDWSVELWFEDLADVSALLDWSTSPLPPPVLMLAWLVDALDFACCSVELSFEPFWVALVEPPSLCGSQRQSLWPSWPLCPSKPPNDFTDCSWSTFCLVSLSFFAFDDVDASLS